MISENETMVSWLEQKEESAAIQLAQVNRVGIVGERFIVAESKSSRQSGFPRMVKNKNQIIFAWTNVAEVTSVKSIVVDLD